MATHIQTYGRPIRLNVSKTLSASATTAAVPLFRVTGMVEVFKLYGVVTTVLGANHTGAFWRLNDQTAQVDISLSTGGATMSGEVVGTVITRNDVAAGANVATVVNAGAGRINDTLAAAPGYSVVQIPFLATKKAGENTDIEYVYATTDAPHSGVIQFFVEYKPITADGALVAV